MPINYIRLKKTRVKIHEKGVKKITIFCGGIQKEMIIFLKYIQTTFSLAF